MEIYLGTLFIFFLFAIFEQFSDSYRSRKKILWVSYLWTVALIGLRWETGTDWLPYVDIFNSVDTLRDPFSQDLGIEKGYIVFNWIIKFFNGDYGLLLLLHAVIFYYCIIFGLAKFTKYPQMAFLLFFAEFLGIVGSSRQLLALAIIFYFLSLAYHRNKKYFLAVVFSAFFHTTAVISSIFYFLNRRIQIIVIVITIIIAAIIGLTPLPKIIFGGFANMGSSAAERVSVYMSNETVGQLGVLGIVRRILFLGAFLYYRKIGENLSKYYNFFLNTFVVSIIIYVMFSSSLLILVNRGSLYFNLSQCILLSYFVYGIKKPDTKLLISILFFVLSIIMVYQSISAYPEEFDPYKSFWFNKDFYRSYKVN